MYFVLLKKLSRSGSIKTSYSELTHTNIVNEDDGRCEENIIIIKTFS
ncbi:hypothetical protein [Clostridium sp. Cult3]|nr:hypothetical protein [Clostridium sp. Cult3]